MTGAAPPASPVIIVTGTKRSGTSMWMQILQNAGLKIIGDKFPGYWRESIGAANPRGFYESPWRNGLEVSPAVHVPPTGAGVERAVEPPFVIKMFAAGLLRTPPSYILRVIATMRQCSVFCSSVRRLYRIESDFFRDLQNQGVERPPPVFSDELADPEDHWKRSPPELEWWRCNYRLLKAHEAGTYPIWWTTYDRVLRDPEREISHALSFLGHGDVSSAAQAVETELHTADVSAAHPLFDEFIHFFDELYEIVGNTRTLPSSLFRELDRVNSDIEERWRHASPH